MKSAVREDGAHGLGTCWQHKNYRHNPERPPDTLRLQAGLHRPLLECVHSAWSRGGERARLSFPKRMLRATTQYPSKLA